MKFLVVTTIVFVMVILNFCDGRFFDFGEKEFNVYWNAPTMQCHSRGIYFNLSEFNIIQNENDEFRGNRISILYDPGYFPALLKNGSTRSFYFRNGGVPQQGDLSEHLKIFQQQIDDLIPDQHYKGLAVIDFESWRPIFRQNFGSLQPYRDVSYDIERQKHPLWRNQSVITFATFEFEKAGRSFMESTISLANQLRPNATWGYYAYPYCFNMNGGNTDTFCPAPVPRENDRASWLFDSVDGFFPSVYFNEAKLNAVERQKLIKGRIAESVRLAHLTRQAKVIYPYFWYKYQDTGEFLTKEDLVLSMHQLKSSRVDGVILWGSSNDVNTKSKCTQLADFVENVLGPIIKSTFS